VTKVKDKQTEHHRISNLTVMYLANLYVQTVNNFTEATEQQ